MNRNEILAAVKDLSYSQGFYGRVYEQLINNEEMLDYLESQHFGDVVDMVMFIES